jgi:Zn-dependent M28 family amino/carboxypeptidase
MRLTPAPFLASILLLALASASAWANPACLVRTNDTPEKLLECVTLDGVRLHQSVLQAIADVSDGTRLAGTRGYDLSATYVAFLMRAVGYHVQEQPFDFTSYRPLGPSTLEQTAPTAVTYVEETDYTLVSQTVPGDVVAPVTAVDLQLGPGNTSTSGCEPEDFSSFPIGNIALIQRGTCSFQQKAEHAAAAGAVGVILFNQGNTADRQGLLNGTLSAEYAGGIPVLFATYDRGVEWSGTPGLVLHMVADVFRAVVTTVNVIAESRFGRSDSVVMVGAHLDSVPEGPGINDNGSGSAALLEVALYMHNVRPHNKVRFAWWSAEESGLIGSNFYVNALSPAEQQQIALYLNFDMVGSPNYVRFIYDGDGSTFGLAGPPGSEAIEALFADFYTGRELAFEPTEIDFRSDYAAFFNAGIPFGGLFTGAEGIKTPEQAALYGGVAGEPYDPCYHQACDTFANVNLEVLDLNADAIAFATLHYAMESQPPGAQMATQLPGAQARRGVRPLVPAHTPERTGHRFVR